MNEIIDALVRLSNDYSGLFVISTIIILIWGLYNKIKFMCLEKASEMVAVVEKYDELTGEQKFALCMTWINSDLPKIFRNSLFKSVIEKMIDFSYNNSRDYMKNYIKRKTNTNVDEIVGQAKKTSEYKNENKYNSDDDW